MSIFLHRDSCDSGSEKYICTNWVLDKNIFKVYNSGNVYEKQFEINEVCYDEVLKKFDHHVLYNLIVLYNYEI